MNYTTTNISFACRSSKANKRGESPVELVININGDRSYLTLPMKMSADKFKKDMDSKRGNSTKEFCETAKTRVNGLITDLLKFGMTVNTANIKKAYFDGIKNTYSLEDMFADYLKILYAKSKGSADSVRKYELARDFFFSIINNKDANELTNADILLFEAEVKKKFKESTAAGYMTRLKTFVSFALNNNKIKTNPFIGIKIKKAKTEVVTITEFEYQKMRDKEFSIQRLDKVRDLAVLQCNCGLSFCDLLNLKKEDFIQEGDSIIIDKQRQKTEVKFCTVILKDGLKILEKYDYDVSKIALSNQKMNSYLKEIQDLCGIKVNLHSHAFRHYYATKLVKNGVPLAVVQKCLGHSNIKTTIGTYTHLLNKDVVSAVEKHIS